MTRGGFGASSDGDPIFFGEFFPPQFWEFFSAFLFRGLKQEGRNERK